MSTDTTITGTAIEALGEKLDRAGILAAHEMDLLVSIFVLAGQAVADHDAEVTGFGSDLAALGACDGSVRISSVLLLPAVRPSGIAAGFTFGLHNPPMDKSLLGGR